MLTHHLNAGPKDFANIVIMSGDPLRTKWISENYLHNAKLINSIRGALAYTGYTKNNIRISLMTSGMGNPSMGIYSYELYKFFNVDYIIRIGTCGAFQPDIDLFDVLLIKKSVTDSNWAKQYKKKSTYAPSASPSLYKAAEKILKKNKR